MCGGLVEGVAGARRGGGLRVDFSGKGDKEGDGVISAGASVAEGEEV